MSVLIRDSRTGIVTSTDLFGTYLDLFLRQNPNYSLVGIAITNNAIYYPLLNDTTVKFNDPFVQKNFVFNPGLTRLGIGTNDPKSTVDIDGKLTVRKKLDVGIGGTILTAIASEDPNIVGIATTSYGNVGIGSTIPQQKLDIAGSAKIDKFIYDSVNSPGINGYYLNVDNSGIRWVDAVPKFSNGILIQDEGVYIPTSGLAKSFTVLNFTEINSFGIGNDNLSPIPNPSNPDFIADIQTKDFWGYTGSGDIYRMTKVGINNNSPSYQLDVTGNANITSNLNVGGTLEVVGATTLDSTLETKGDATFDSTVTLKSSLYDINNSAAIGKTDYRLASVGTGVSWRPPGVQTQKTIWVTLDGNDSNSGLLEGDAKRSIGAAAAIAEPGDTIFVRSGIYVENNPIGLRDDVSVSGQDLRLVTVIPNNLGKDIFHVRRGCLIENLNFACVTGQSNPGGGALAFPPTTTDILAGKSFGAVSGYTAPGPATEGSSGRWRSPYVRNCTNFMPLSIGMKINGDHATASTIGADLKCMVCDSFTQYNEAGIGVSITNNGYAQLVSIFTINCDKAIYVDTGGQCDLTNSNSSFGNYGLYAVGLGRTEFTGKVKENTSPQNADGRLNDKVGLTSVFYVGTNTPRRPYDGQALWFKINLTNYTDTVGSGIITAPLQRLASISVIDNSSATTYSSSSPPSILIQDVDGTYTPKGPQGIIAEVSANIDDTIGKIVSIDIINSGRNYLSSQDIRVVIDGTVQDKNKYLANMEPIYFTVLDSTDNSASPTGITTTTFNEFIPYELFADDEIELRRISRILTSTHSFEYIGAGTNINTATPQFGGVPIKANEIVKLDGAQIPFTSTDQKGNFDIGEGIQVNQTTSTISGRDFSRAIQAEVTPLILALR